MERRRKDEHEVVAGKNYFSEYLDQGAAEEGASPSSSSGKSANTNSSSDRIAVMDVGPEVEVVANQLKASPSHLRVSDIHQITLSDGDESVTDRLRDFTVKGLFGDSPESVIFAN